MKPDSEEIATTRNAIDTLGVCVIIPTYNNAATLPEVVRQVRAYTDSVIIVNDGSTDSTPALLSDLDDSATVISYAKNRGKGHALKQGFLKARQMGFRYAITIDSDGQHRPSDIPRMVRAIARNPGALIVGSRNLENVDINAKSTFANRFSNFWFTVQTLRTLPDTQSGFRAYPLDELHGLGLLTNRYEAELQLLVMAAWHGVRIVPVPIDVHYPPRRERVSHFRPITDFARISALNTVLCAAAILYGLPLRTWNLFRRKQLFNGEFRLFTRRKGKVKEAPVTLGRLARSAYALTFFIFWSVFIFTPLTWLYFAIGKNTDKKRDRYHRILHKTSLFLSSNFPGAPVRFENVRPQDFDRPSVIIANHQSHLDLPVLMAMHPRLVFLTNDWVWNNFFYGVVVRNAEYLPVSIGTDELLDRLGRLRDRGYSIVVFPEGTRSADCSILRFHKGAFKLAQDLQMDIRPVIIHGVGHFLPKNDFMFRRNPITVRMTDLHGRDWIEATTLQQQAAHFRQIFRQEYRKIACDKENPQYFSALIRYKYSWRGWRTLTKAKNTLDAIEPYTPLILSLRNVPQVTVLNSGIGVFAHIIALVNPDTRVTAVESCTALHDIAASTPAPPENLTFENRDWQFYTPRGGEKLVKTVNSKIPHHQLLQPLTIILGCEHENFLPDNNGTIRLKIKS